MTAHPKAYRPPSTRQIDASASEWVIRLNGKLTRALWSQFEDWLASDPRNEAAYLKQEQSWNRIRHLVKKIRTGDAPTLERLAEKTPRGRPVPEPKAAAPSTEPAHVESPRPLLMSDPPRASLEEPRFVAVISTPAQDHACEAVSTASQPEGSTPASIKWLEECIPSLLSSGGQLPSNPRGVKPLVLSAPVYENILNETALRFDSRVIEGNSRVAALREILRKRGAPSWSLKGISGLSRMVFLCKHHASTTRLIDPAQLLWKQLTLTLQGHSHESVLGASGVIHVYAHGSAGLEEHVTRDSFLEAQSLDSTVRTRFLCFNACESTFAVRSNRSRSKQGDWYTWLSRYAELVDMEAELTLEKYSELFSRNRALSSELALPLARGSLKLPTLIEEQVRRKVAKASEFLLYSPSEEPTERTDIDEEWIAAAESFQRYALR